MKNSYFFKINGVLEKLERIDSQINQKISDIRKSQRITQVINQSFNNKFSDLLNNMRLDLNNKSQDLIFEDALTQACEKYFFNKNIIRKIILALSNGDAKKISADGKKKGLGQITDEIAFQAGVRDLFDPYQNLMATCFYLDQELRFFNGKLEPALISLEHDRETAIRIFCSSRSSELQLSISS